MPIKIKKSSLKYKDSEGNMQEVGLPVGGVITDATLTKSGVPADAKVTGEKIEGLVEKTASQQTEINNKQPKGDYATNEKVGKLEEQVADLTVGNLFVNTPTKNKKMLIFGDSITRTATMNDDGSNYIEGVTTSWLTYAKEILKTTNFKNYAESGARYKDSSDISGRQWLSNQIAIAMSDSNNDDAEIIILPLGTNDGEANDTYEDAMAISSINELDRTKLHQAIRYAMWSLKTKYPNAKCFAATPIQRASKEQPVSLRNAIISMANRYNFKVIDAEYESGICRDNEVLNGSGVDLSDGLHPNTNGEIKLARYYSSVILGEFLYDSFKYQEIEEIIKLPEEYQQVEYIESSGTQYIDTGILASDYSDGIGYEFNGVVYSTNTDNEWIWGALANGCRAGNLMVSLSYERFTIVVGSTTNVIRYNDLILDEDIKLNAFATATDPSKTTMSLNGVNSSADQPSSASSDIPSINIWLLKCNGSSRTGLKAKLHGFKMTDVNNTELRNFVPCYRKADSVIGLYDTVTETFFTNAGTGTFAKGEDVA